MSHIVLETSARTAGREEDAEDAPPGKQAAVLSARGTFFGNNDSGKPREMSSAKWQDEVSARRTTAFLHSSHKQLEVAI